MIKKLDMRKTLQYKYIQYRFKKECLKNNDLQNLSQEEKESICIEAAKKTRNVTWIVIMIYIPAMVLFIYGFVLNYKYLDNAFVKWYQGIIESVFPLINGDWGGTWYQKKGTFLLIYIKLIPVAIIQGTPLFLPIMIMANRFLKKEMKEIMRKNK